MVFGSVYSEEQKLSRNSFGKIMPLKRQSILQEGV
jgi:hypothetical protein